MDMRCYFGWFWNELPRPQRAVEARTLWTSLVGRHVTHTLSPHGRGVYFLPQLLFVCAVSAGALYQTPQVSCWTFELFPVSCCFQQHLINNFVGEFFNSSVIISFQGKLLEAVVNIAKLPFRKPTLIYSTPLSAFWLAIFSVPLCNILFCQTFRKNSMFSFFHLSSVLGNSDNMGMILKICPQLAVQ